MCDCYIEGDQVLEWNGVPLSGKSYERVKSIIDDTPCINGELELVVKQLVTVHCTPYTVRRTLYGYSVQLFISRSFKLQSSIFYSL